MERPFRGQLESESGVGFTAHPALHFLFSPLDRRYIPVGWSTKSQVRSKRSARCRARARTPNVSVA